MSVVESIVGSVELDAILDVLLKTFYTCAFSSFFFYLILTIVELLQLKNYVLSVKLSFPYQTKIKRENENLINQSNNKKNSQKKTSLKSKKSQGFPFFFFSFNWF